MAPTPHELYLRHVAREARFMIAKDRMSREDAIRTAFGLIDPTRYGVRIFTDEPSSDELASVRRILAEG